jgi:hypothetical protein
VPATSARYQALLHFARKRSETFHCTLCGRAPIAGFIVLGIAEALGDRKVADAF